MRETLRVAYRGVPFDVEIGRPLIEVSATLESLSLARAVFRRRPPRIVAHVDDRDVHMHHLRVVNIARPELRGRLEPSDTGTRLSGRFTFGVLARSALWLGLLASVAQTASGALRFANAVLDDARTEDLVGFGILALAGPVIAVTGVLALRHLWWRARADATLLLDALRG